DLRACAPWRWSRPCGRLPIDNRVQMRWMQIGRVAPLVAVATLICVPATGATARPPTSCSAAPGRGLTLANIAADGSRLVAVGSDGLIAASTGPGRWVVRATPVKPH